MELECHHGVIICVVNHDAVNLNIHSNPNYLGSRAVCYVMSQYVMSPYVGLGCYEMHF